MTRLSISLSEERHRALKEAAARQGKTIARIIDESLEQTGIKSSSQAKAMVAQARERASMREEEAIELGVSETRDVRRRR